MLIISPRKKLEAEALNYEECVNMFASRTKSAESDIDSNNIQIFQIKDFILDINSDKIKFFIGKISNLPRKL